MPEFASKRPENRHFTSPALEALIAEVSAGVRDPELAWLFSNCFPCALDTGLADRTSPPGGLPEAADSGCYSISQLWPYLSLANEDPALKSLLAGAIKSQAASISLNCGQFPLDRLCAFLRLCHGLWSTTADPSCFDPAWESAVSIILSAFEKNQAGSSEKESGAQPASAQQSISRNPEFPFKRCGLIRSPSRPSGEPALFAFHVPANAMAVVCLGQLAEMLRQLNRALPQAQILAQRAESMAASIHDGLGHHAIVHHPAHGEILAYELDGFGSHYLMEDASFPSLLSLPYLGCCPKNDPLYQRTRSFVLSSDNPYFIEGSAGRGIGGPRLGSGWISSSSIIMQALTSDSDEEIATCLGILKATHPGNGFIGEAFWKNDPSKISRPCCAPANSLFAELILTLRQQRPHILEASFNRCGR